MKSVIFLEQISAWGGFDTYYWLGDSGKLGDSGRLGYRNSIETVNEIVLKSNDINEIENSLTHEQNCCYKNLAHNFSVWIGCYVKAKA